MERYYKFGYELFGPFLYGFVRWLKNELIQKDYDKVFFFSRDGYLMKKAFEIINDTSIHAEYAYFSRNSLRIPLLHNCKDFEDSLKYLSWERYVTFSKLLGYYGFDRAESIQIALHSGFELEDSIAFEHINSNSTIRRFYEENKSIINARSLEQDSFLKEYMKHLGMCGKIAIVDIGWHGNMQYYLEQFIAANGIDIHPEGFYIGIDSANKLVTPVNGYLYDNENMRNRKKILCFLGGYEKLLQSSEGSSAGFERIEDGKVIPVLMPYEYDGDDRIIKAVKNWQFGALRFVKKAYKTGLTDSDRKLTEPLMHFGMKPSISDTKFFSFFYINDGKKDYFTAQKSLLQYKPNEFIHDFSASLWKTGFMKSIFKVPLPYYLIYKILKK